MQQFLEQHTAYTVADKECSNIHEVINFLITSSISCSACCLAAPWRHRQGGSGGL